MYSIHVHVITNDYLELDKLEIQNQQSIDLSKLYEFHLPERVSIFINPDLLSQAILTRSPSIQLSCRPRISSLTWEPSSGICPPLKLKVNRLFQYHSLDRISLKRLQTREKVLRSSLPFTKEKTQTSASSGKSCNIAISSPQISGDHAF